MNTYIYICPFEGDPKKGLLLMNISKAHWISKNLQEIPFSLFIMKSKYFKDNILLNSRRNSIRRLKAYLSKNNQKIVKKSFDIFGKNEHFTCKSF